MIRLLVVVSLVCAVCYIAYPRESQVVASRVAGHVRSAALGVVGAVRSTLPQPKEPRPATTGKMAAGHHAR